MSRAAALAHFLLQALQCRVPEAVLQFAITDSLLWLSGEAVVDVDGALGKLLPEKCHHHTGSGLCQRLCPGPQEACSCPVEPGVSVQIGGQEVAWMHSKGSHPNFLKMSSEEWGKEQAAQL